MSKVNHIAIRKFGGPTEVTLTTAEGQGKIYHPTAASCDRLDHLVGFGSPITNRGWFPINFTYPNGMTVLYMKRPELTVSLNVKVTHN